MASGVDVDPECQLEYNKLLKHHEYPYIIFEIENDKCIKVAVKGQKQDAPDAPSGKADAAPVEFATFLSELREATEKSKPACRYAVWDVKFCNKEGQRRDKIIFITWCPEHSSVKQKMLYSSSKDYLKKKLEGLCGNGINGTDYDEISWNTIFQYAKSLGS